LRIEADMRTNLAFGRLFAAFLMAGIAAGCAGKASAPKKAAPAAPPPAEIVGLWVAEDVAGTAVPADARITLSLYANGKTVGRGGCNTYSGSYKRSGDAITFTPVVATMMACDQGIMAREQLYFETLKAVTKVQRPADGSLVLSTDAGASMRFRRQEAAALQDARSRGVTFRGIGQEPGWVVELTAGKTITALIDYGATTITLPAPDATESEGVTTYDTSTDTDHLVLKIRNKTCVDVMSGEPHPQIVELTVNDKPYSGCGDWLR
jgi:heat shock protein HslJ